MINANAPITAAVGEPAGAAGGLRRVFGRRVDGIQQRWSGVHGNSEALPPSKAWTLSDSDGTRDRLRAVPRCRGQRVVECDRSDRHGPPSAGRIGTLNFTAISTISRNAEARVTAAPATAANRQRCQLLVRRRSLGPMADVLGECLQFVPAGRRWAQDCLRALRLERECVVTCDGRHLPGHGRRGQAVSINAGAVYTNNRTVTLRPAGPS